VRIIGEIMEKTIALIANISQIVLAICAIIALIQIWLNKLIIKENRRQTEIQIKRDALKCSSEQISYFNNILLPIIDDIDTLTMENKLDIFSKDNVGIENRKISIRKRNTTKEKRDCIIKNISNFARMLNGIESFATYFVSGIADEKFAYNAVGKTYCEIIYKYMIIFFNDEDDLKSPIFELFFIWNDRFAINKKRRMVEMLNDQLSGIKEDSITVTGL
jgi:hypothetical protein